MAKSSDVLSASKKKKAKRLLDAGDLIQGRALLERLCQQNKRDFEAWVLLGVTLERLQSPHDAATAYRQALELNAAAPMVHFNLGNALFAAGQLEQAAASYERALELQPDWPEVLNNLGRVQQLADQPEAAIEAYRGALRLRPGMTKTLYNVGLLYAQTGDPLQAIEYYQRALSAQPKWPEVQLKLAGACLDVGELQRAERWLHELLNDDPGNAEAHCMQGELHRVLGNFEAALASHREARRLKPALKDAAAGEALALHMLGDSETAYHELNALADKGALTADGMELLLKLCRRFGDCERAAALAEAALDREDLPPRAQSILSLALGAHREAAQQYEAAFVAYRRGNDRMKVAFDPKKQQEEFERITRFFSAERLATLPRDSAADAKPVFIVGMPRSGTSLVEQMLAQHPQVTGAGELAWLSQLAHGLGPRLGSKAGFPEATAGLTRAQVDALAREYLEQLPAMPVNGRYVTDKMPANFLYLGLIQLLFPGARIIHCARDPMDTCLSIYALFFGPRMPFAYDLAHIGAFYRGYRRLMEHWEQVLSLPMITVRYEDLVREPEGQVRRLLEFLDLEWDPACLAFHASDRRIATASHDQVRKPLYTSSVGRWRRFAPYLEQLAAELAVD